MTTLLERAARQSLCPDQEALSALLGMATSRLPGGVVVELGTNSGGSAALLAQARRPLWVFDTWAGIPAPDGPELDGQRAQGMGGTMRASQDEARRFIMQEAPGVDLHMVRGNWLETLPQVLGDIPQIAILHLDGDWYHSVLEPLRLLAPRVAPGGWIVLDDFGWWEGARRAFYQWTRETGEEPLLVSHGRHQAYWQVGKEHHRPRRA